jgi:hypothetical protein
MILRNPSSKVQRRENSHNLVQRTGGSKNGEKGEGQRISTNVSLPSSIGSL